MTRLKLTSAAFRALYGGDRIVIADPAQLEDVKAAAGTAFRLLLADASGAIRGADETADAAADLPVMGAPLNLCAYVLSKTLAPVAREWGAELLLAKTDRKPDILLVKADDTAPAHTIGRFFNGLQNRLVTELAARAGSLEAQTLHLRQANERLMLEINAARRVIEGIGYSDLTVVAEVPLGTGSVGPGAGTDCDRFSQLLPADGLGLAAIGLYVGRSGAGSEGVLRLRVARDFDGKLLAERTLAYDEMTAGWTMVRFDGAIADVFGDVRLNIDWLQADAGGKAPWLAVSDVWGNRFGGDTDGLSLALRLFKSACQPALGAEATALVPAEVGPSVHMLPAQHGSALDFYGGADRLAAVRADVGFDPYVCDPKAGWVQAHLASDGLTGLCLVGIVPDRAEQAILSVAVPEAAGPEVAFHAFLTDSAEGLEARVGSVLSGGDAAEAGLDHGMVCLSGGKSGQVAVTAQVARGSGRTLVLVAKSLSGRTGHGWCRWTSASFRMPAEPAVSRVAPCLLPPEGDKAGRRVIRAIKLPELAGMVQFIEGADKLADLTASLGFSPMIMDENGGYLQTHPLVNILSGALLPALVAPGTHKLAAAVHTGHRGAPDFIYAMILVRQDVADVAGAARSALEGIDPDIQGQQTGGDGRIFWSSLRLGGGGEGRIELQFPEALGAVYHLVLTARPVKDAISFGWCRWTALGIMGFETGIGG